jgi:hypothetical protein
MLTPREALHVRVHRMLHFRSCSCCAGRRLVCLVDSSTASTAGRVEKLPSPLASPAAPPTPPAPPSPPSVQLGCAKRKKNACTPPGVSTGVGGNACNPIRSARGCPGLLWPSHPLSCSILCARGTLASETLGQGALQFCRARWACVGHDRISTCCSTKGLLRTAQWQWRRSWHRRPDASQRKAKQGASP